MKSNIIQGDALTELKKLPSESVNCIVTSPPYFGLRNYNIDPIIYGGNPDCEHEFNLTDKKDPMDRNGCGDHDKDGLHGNKIDYKTYKVGYCKKCQAWKGNLGLEPHPQEYVNHIVEIVSECMRVLRKDGVMFLNIGDSYGSHKSGKDAEKNRSKNDERLNSLIQRNSPTKDLKDDWYREKQKLLIPHRIAIALQEKGFLIRDDIVWVKKLNIFPNRTSIGSTMPFPVKDKLLPATEYIFQITKSKKYYMDLKNVKTKIKNSTIERAKRPISSTYTNKIEGNPYTKHDGMKGYYDKIKDKYIDDNDSARRIKINLCVGKEGYNNWNVKGGVGVANPTNAIMFRRMNQNSKRAVQEHFASYPTSLTDFFISIACPKMGTILDPFMGSGTTGISASKQGKSFIGIELNPKYIEIAKKRIKPFLEQTKLK